MRAQVLKKLFLISHIFPIIIYFRLLFIGDDLLLEFHSDKSN